MKIATWNVNSVRQRQTHVARWLETHAPDLLLLQEIKCETKVFPAEVFSSLGYESVAVGQKAYNGVAILSRLPFTVTQRHLPGLALPETGEHQARYVEVEAAGITVGNLYLPNGNSGGPDGYAAKLAWMDALTAHARTLLAAETDFILAGDYNVCPTDEDMAPGIMGADDALVRPETRERFRALQWLGLTDAVRAITPGGPVYTFWDYQAGCWPRDRGLRIDHAMLSPRIAERLVDAIPDRAARDEVQPSDHVPVVVTLR
ncbi:MAG: exodeoxyribonuclease III [Janthinobacterium lividum]